MEQRSRTLEAMGLSKSRVDAVFWQGKRVLVTGHTGFKGAWMLQILHWLGADVKGYSLAPEKPQDLFNQIDGTKLCSSSVFADLKLFTKSTLNTLKIFSIENIAS